MKVAYFVMRYPWRSQTFIAREMRSVCGHGVAVEVHPIWDWRLRPPAAPPEDGAAGLKLVRVSPWRILLGAAPALWREWRRDRGELFRRGWAMLRQHRPRTFEGWLHTLWGALFALVRADEFRRRGEVAHFHAAWATAPATAAWTLGALTGRPWSFGAHAYDLHRSGGDPLLTAKLRAAAFVHTSTLSNVTFLETHFPGRRAPVVLARRGLEKLGLRGLPRPRRALEPHAGPHVLSVGRLVEKKGHLHQIAACQELRRRGQPFRLRIVGDGPLRPDLERAIRAAELDDCVELAGALEPFEVGRAYDWAHIFWHTGVVDREGDRDGLPNVIPEAFAHALPVISSAVGGAGEAVFHEKTGLIVEPTDPRALADAIERLTHDGALRQWLGAAGRAWVEENFLAEKNTARLAEAFRHAAVVEAPL